jgi:hypothetical protein
MHKVLAATQALNPASKSSTTLVLIELPVYSRAAPLRYSKVYPPNILMPSGTIFYLQGENISLVSMQNAMLQRKVDFAFRGINGEHLEVHQ